MEITIPGHVLYVEVDEQSVLMDINSGMYFALDEVGSKIWDYLKAELDYNSIIQSISNEYEIDSNVIAEDLDIFINNLKNSNLIIIKE